MLSVCGVYFIYLKKYWQKKKQLAQAEVAEARLAEAETEIIRGQK